MDCICPAEPAASSQGCGAQKKSLEEVSTIRELIEFSLSDSARWAPQISCDQVIRITTGSCALFKGVVLDTIKLAMAKELNHAS
jgi:hypothetical protein